VPRWRLRAGERPAALLSRALARNLAQAHKSALAAHPATRDGVDTPR
jgi:hypothetical protein